MKTRTNEITNNLAAIREQRGLSASALAGMVGVSRQTIYAVEAGSYIPNTAVGLRLAAALSVAVEKLFSLPGPQTPEPKSETATLLPSLEALHPGDEVYPGEPVRLCDVNGRLVAAPSAPHSWYLPPSDGLIAGRAPVRGKTKVHLHEPNTKFHNRLLIAGCDPAMAVAARYLQQAGVDLVLLHRNSLQSLSLLKRGYVHIAGTHLRDESTGESNLSAIKKIFPKDSVAAISFAIWEEGLVVPNGNPKRIEGVQDLTRRDITFLNRESGAGSRLLLDNRLKRMKLAPKRVRGYDRTAAGHLAAARQVKTGAADCCIAIRAAARVFGLDFIPLETSRYDLVLREEHLKLPSIQALFDVLNRLSFRRELNSVGAYDTTATGGRIL